MLKNIIVGCCLILSNALFSQSFEILDSLDNSIGSSYTFFGNGNVLSKSPKFHVKNLTSVSKSFKIIATDITNPTATDLQVCYGGVCESVPAGSVAYDVGSAQAVVPPAIFDALKITPFSFSWALGDSAVWDIELVDVANTNDVITTRVKWIYNGTVGVNNYELLNTISIYPNPSVSIFNIHVQNSTYTTIDLIDAVGEKVLEQEFTNQLDVSSLSKGVYFIRLKGDGVEPFIKKVLIE